MAQATFDGRKIMQEATMTITITHMREVKARAWTAARFVHLAVLIGRFASWIAGTKTEIVEVDDATQTS